jgi:NADPH-dependent 2,4-dienoyl-CoA reductase/sulfur reductase-like enzyme
MKSITVIGAGAAGLSFVEAFRTKDSDTPVTLIDRYAYSFRRSDLLALNFKNRPDLVQWAAQKKVTFCQAGVERVNFSRRKIYLKEREPLDYNILVVTCGLNSCKTGIKGEHRQGFFYLSGLEPLAFRDEIKLSQEAAVYAASFLGLKLAAAFVKAHKDVRIFPGDWSFLPDSGAAIAARFQENGAFFNPACSIEEAIGEGTVKAVKVLPLKIYSAQMLLLDSGFVPNRDIFEEGVEFKPYGVVGQENVYLAGDVNNALVENERFFLYNYQNAEAQGRLLAGHLIDGRPLEPIDRISGAEDKQQAVEELLTSLVKDSENATA